MISKFYIQGLAIYIVNRIDTEVQFSEHLLQYVTMMIAILFIVIALVAWALHLMQEAIEHQEFSLMLAGTLVATAAAAMVGVYFLMGNCMQYITHLSPREAAWNQEAYESIARYLDEQDQLYLNATPTRSISQVVSNIDH